MFKILEECGTSPPKVLNTAYLPIRRVLNVNNLQVRIESGGEEEVVEWQFKVFACGVFRIDS